MQSIWLQSEQSICRNPECHNLKGTRSGFNLATPDPAGAKRFYGGLFGWEWADVPMSGGNTYHMAIQGDANIAGMSADASSGQPASVWINHIYVADAEKDSSPHRRQWR